MARVCRWETGAKLCAQSSAEDAVRGCIVHGAVCEIAGRARRGSRGTQKRASQRQFIAISFHFFSPIYGHDYYYYCTPREKRLCFLFSRNPLVTRRCLVSLVHDGRLVESATLNRAA